MTSHQKKVGRRPNRSGGEPDRDDNGGFHGSAGGVAVDLGDDGANRTGECRVRYPLSDYRGTGGRAGQRATVTDLSY